MGEAARCSFRSLFEAVCAWRGSRAGRTPRHGLTAQGKTASCNAPRAPQISPAERWGSLELLQAAQQRVGTDTHTCEREHTRVCARSCVSMWDLGHFHLLCVPTANNSKET